MLRAQSLTVIQSGLGSRGFSGFLFFGSCSSRSRFTFGGFLHLILVRFSQDGKLLEQLCLFSNQRCQSMHVRHFQCFLSCGFGSTSSLSCLFPAVLQCWMSARSACPLELVRSIRSIIGCLLWDELLFAERGKGSAH